MRRLALIAALVGCSGPSREAPPPSSSDAVPSVDPVTAGFIPDSLEAIGVFLRDRVADSAFPGGVLVIGGSGGIVYRTAVGVYGVTDPRPVTDTTMYDLASLTKVVGLTTATMLLVAEGRIDLDRPVVDYVPEFDGPGKTAITPRHLLTHTSGLPAWIPLYQETTTREDALHRVYTEPLEHEPGAVYTYSDLGAILMTQVVERAAGHRLDTLLRQSVFEPLGMRDTRFTPPIALIDRIAPTERDPWRGRIVRGEVHDENAYRLGGVAGHAGLFSTGPDLARFAIWLLDAYHDRLGGDDRPKLPAELVRRFTRRQPGPEDSYRAIGWAKPHPGGGTSAGHLLSASSFGHTGFTGTSIWLDPEQDLFIILLTNRVNPTRDNQKHIPVRSAVADMAVRARAVPVR